MNSTGMSADWLAALNGVPASHAAAAVVALTLIAATILWARLQRRQRARIEQKTASDIAALQSRCKAQSSALLMLSERVSALEEYLELMGNRQQRLDQDRQRKEFYQQAIGLAAQHVSAEELKQRCAISDVEAELIELLYSKQKVSAE